MGKIIALSNSHNPFLCYLDGLLCGDGCIGKRGYGHCRYSQGAAESKLEWLLRVKERFKRKGITSSISSAGQGKVQVQTQVHPMFDLFRSRWYPEGSKRVPHDVHLCPDFLAPWYLGDGQLKKRDGIYIHTNNFPEEGVVYLCDQLWKQQHIGAWHIEYDHTNQPGQYVVRIRVADVPRFLNLIEPFRIACFSYKFEFSPALKRQKKWLPREREYLIQNYRSKHGVSSNVKFLADKLGRTERSIFDEASRLSLTRG